MRHILEQALKKIASLPEKEKAKFNEQMSGFLKKQGHDLGCKTALEWLTAPGMAGAGALVGTQLATGIILAHLGVYHGVLFALGLWAIPAGWLAATAALIFAPLMGGALVYILGQHNFKKTIPCVAIIASIRQEAFGFVKKTIRAFKQICQRCVSMAGVGMSAFFAIPTSPAVSIKRKHYEIVFFLGNQYRSGGLGVPIYQQLCLDDRTFLFHVS